MRDLIAALAIFGFCVGIGAAAVVWGVIRDHVDMERPNTIPWTPPPGSSPLPPPGAEAQHAGQATYEKPKEMLALPRGDR